MRGQFQLKHGSWKATANLKTIQSCIRNIHPGISGILDNCNVLTTSSKIPVIHTHVFRPSVVNNPNNPPSWFWQPSVITHKAVKNTQNFLEYLTTSDNLILWLFGFKEIYDECLPDSGLSNARLKAFFSLVSFLRTRSDCSACSSVPLSGRTVVNPSCCCCCRFCSRTPISRALSFRAEPLLVRNAGSQFTKKTHSCAKLKIHSPVLISTQSTFATTTQRLHIYDWLAISNSSERVIGIALYRFQWSFKHKNERQETMYLNTNLPLLTHQQVEEMCSKTKLTCQRTLWHLGPCVQTSGLVTLRTVIETAHHCRPEQQDLV